MNSKTFTYLITSSFLWLLIGCNKVYDIQEPDTETVPEATVTAIESAYPDAGNFIFKTLIKDKLWKAGFVSNAANFETQVSPAAIVSAVYKASSDISLYKELTDKLKVKGGTISGLQVIDKDVASGARMKYLLDGKSYLLNYYTLNDLHVLKLTANLPSESFSIDNTDLPENILLFCQQKSITLTNSMSTVLADPDGKKTFYIYPEGQLYPIIFNNAGELTWIARNSDSTAVVNKPNSEVGSAELLSKVGEGYSDFTTPTNVAFESQFDNLKSVRYLFQKKSGVEGTRTFINELREVFVNASTGEIIYDQYSSYVSR